MAECIFCSSKNNLIESKEKAICKSCVVTAYFISETQIKEKTKKEIKINSPKYYKEVLNDFVIGQEEAKNVLSVAIFNHMTRINNPKVEMNKNNIILIGDSGQGKTLIVETLAKHLDIPFVIVNTTSLTSSGYSGEDVSSIIEKLLDKAKGSIKSAQKGIVFLDEIDKITSTSTSGKDVSGKAVQQELLKYLEGDKVTVYINKTATYEGDKIEIDTKNILFIGAGAFPNLDFKESTIKLPGQKSKPKQKTLLTDLEKYGFIPEFLGRFSSITRLEKLDKKAYKRILTEPKNNSVDKLKNLLKVHNIEIELKDSLLDEIVDRSIGTKIGVRALQKNIDEMFNPFILNIDKHFDKKYSVSYNKGIKFRKIKDN